MFVSRLPEIQAAVQYECIMKFFVKRDLDGFFGLFIDNLVQLLVIISFCQIFCGMTGENARLLYKVILPGSAISILVGNLFYAWQALRLARKTGRDDVTALPYGINTPSVIVYVFFVMAPEFQRTGSALAAWKMGLVACFGSGVIELVGAFIAAPIRRSTPRAALLSTLAGIAIGFIAMTFTLQIFHKPLIAMLPLALVLIGLFSQIRLPLGVPSGFVAVVVGTLSAWGLLLLQRTFPNAPEWLTFGAASITTVQAATANIGLALPVWSGETLWEVLQNIGGWLPLLSVIIPMGLFNVVGSLQNIESAEAAGDSYPTAPSMAANGIGTIIASLFGSCFPTTIYIGHPGWKSLGARAGYSTLNGFVIIALTLSGLISLVAGIVPIEAGAGIVLWIGVIITAQAFRAVPENHASAVAIGLFPAIAAWGAVVMLGTIILAEGKSLQQIIAPPGTVAVESSLPVETQPENDAPTTKKTALPSVEIPHPTAEANGFLIHGLLLMERGYIFTCMILAAASASLIDRKFLAAGIWFLIASLLTFLGAMHAYQVYNGMTFDYLFRFIDPVPGSDLYRANDIAIAYLLCGLLFIGLARWAQGQPVQTH